MNYAGKFDAKLSADGSGLHSPGHGHVETITKHATHAPADAIIVPDPQLLFNGDFKRSGVDLILSKDDHELVLHDYFKGEKRAALSSPDGAHLTGDLVSALTGHTEYAQADGSASVGKVIGHVTKLTGTATAIRNGVSIILNNGDNVEKGDVVQSGSNSTLGITFIDGTVFGLSSNARMVLNEMVYDPNGSNNSSLLSLVAGTITFVAGETAKHGDMKVDTPVATMGIRGTAVLVEIDFKIPGGLNSLPNQSGLPDDLSQLLPEVNLQVLVEPDGTTGSFFAFEKGTLTKIAEINTAGQQIKISSQGLVSITNAPLPPDVQKLITDVFSLKFTDINTKTFDHFTDTVIPQSLQPIILPSGATATPVVLLVKTADNSGPSGQSGPTNSQSAHRPGAGRRRPRRFACRTRRRYRQRRDRYGVQHDQLCRRQRRRSSDGLDQVRFVHLSGRPPQRRHRWPERAAARGHRGGGSQSARGAGPRQQQQRQGDLDLQRRGRRIRLPRRRRDADADLPGAGRQQLHPERGGDRRAVYDHDHRHQRCADDCGDKRGPG